MTQTNYDILKEYEEHNTPVPSYRELQQLKKFCEEFNALNVSKENQRLKEMLKECRSNIDKQIVGTPTYQYWEGIFSGKLLDKIDEVLK